MILYFGWVHHSAYFENRAQALWQKNAHRVVVFGNDWSDTRTYRVSQPSQRAIAARDSDRGDVWVETLCKEVNAFLDSHMSNY